MNWGDEPYVKNYIRDTPEFLAMQWQSRCLLQEIVRKVDRAGILKVGKLGPAKGVAVAIRAPAVELQPFIDELIAEERLIFNEERGELVVPNHIAAQEARQTPGARKRKSRDVARARAISGSQNVTPTSRDVTETPDSVTRGHAKSRGVTIRSDQKRSDQNRDLPAGDPRAPDDDESDDIDDESEEDLSEADGTPDTEIAPALRDSIAAIERSRLPEQPRRGVVARSFEGVTEAVKAACVIAGAPVPTEGNAVAYEAFCADRNRMTSEQGFIFWMTNEGKFARSAKREVKASAPGAESPNVAAYVRGVTLGKGGPYAFPNAPGALEDLQRCVATFAVYSETNTRGRPAGSRIDGPELVEWVEACAEDFAAWLAMHPEKVQFYSSFDPRGFAKWLNETQMRAEARRVG